MIVQVGPYPEPMGGISIYIKRMKKYLDLLGIPNEVWDLSNINKDIKSVTNIRFRYVPFVYLFRRDIKLIHYNICGVNYKVYIGFFNKLLFKKRKKILTIHGESKDLFNNNYNIIIKSLNSFDAIICVKAGDREYLSEKGVNKPIYEIPAFIFPTEDDITIIPPYILDFIDSKSFIISANASSIQFYDDNDLYGIDMCINLVEKLIKNRQDVGLIFCISEINDRSYFNKLKAMIKDKNLLESFLFVNEKMELFPIIKKSQLFLRPTNSDGYGVSIAEAIYCNVPAIASDVCQRPEGSILFNTRDMEDLYNKTIEVIENYEEFKNKIVNIVFDDNAKKILEVYNL
ncbi:glycosyltransferase [Clostridium sp.]|uniref:glycosyltransferase n=1 Tax=Clostridium sp. TaxID=1506 RepID=UPI001A52F5BE|nr:glycosyltransferase [Clostridium sp.]MBK5240619.1 glycosyltransferase family 4 protein [Clostridium sp.]